MSSLSVQGRVESEAWSDIRGRDSNTKALQRLVAHWEATSGGELLNIAPTTEGAIAILLHSHKLLNQILSNGSFAAVASVPAPAIAMASPGGNSFAEEDNSADY